MFKRIFCLCTVSILASVGSFADENNETTSPETIEQALSCRCGKAKEKKKDSEKDHQLAQNDEGNNDEEKSEDKLLADNDEGSNDEGKSEDKLLADSDEGNNDEGKSEDKLLVCDEEKSEENSENVLNALSRRCSTGRCPFAEEQNDEAQNESNDTVKSELIA